MLRSSKNSVNRETDILSQGVTSEEEVKIPTAPPGKLVKQRSRYQGAGSMMARDVVSHLMMKFFFKDQVKNKSKTTRVKDEFLKDMNFTLMSGTVSKATRYLQEISETEQVSS